MIGIYKCSKNTLSIAKSKEYYQKNKEKIYKRTKAYIQKDPEKWKTWKSKWGKQAYQKTMEYFRNYKAEHGCIVCGIKEPIVLDFHHRVSKEKKHGIMYMISGEYSIERILEEVKKCDVICSNHHRLLHNSETPTD